MLLLIENAKIKVLWLFEVIKYHHINLLKHNFKYVYLTGIWSRNTKVLNPCTLFYCSISIITYFGCSWLQPSQPFNLPVVIKYL